ncbi:MAG: molybdate ABC transporter substrate-binding protein [Candidatus Nanopelagicales bacterium]
MSAFSVVTVSACSTANDSDPAISTTVTISAAASLNTAFTSLAERFEAEHPDIEIKVNFGGSGALAEQIAAGAPVDVFASASKATMDQISNFDESPKTFARNQLIVITPAANTGQVTDYQSIQKVSTVVCTESAPCGAAAQKFLSKAGMTANIVSLEPDVKSVLNKVITDEADAGIVYVTDAIAAGNEVVAFTIPPELNVTTDYQIALIKDSSTQNAAQEFLDFLLGPTGVDVLQSEGFMSP